VTWTMTSALPCSTFPYNPYIPSPSTW
jgi:hypothetical protein